MKKFIIFFLVLFLIPTHVYAVTTYARSAILMEQHSHRILYSHNIHEPMLIASITKIMTAVIAIESDKLDDIVVIDGSVLRSYGSGVYIEVGEEISLRNLVYGLMLRSGNDAAIMIMNYVGKDDFINMMNDKAREIGMKNTVFLNPHGLDQENQNYSTAYDMALLTSYAMNLDEYKKIVGTDKLVIKTNMKTYVWHNKNKLLGMYKYCTGGKTGFTKRARRTLVTTASKESFDLVAVTLNDGNDFNDHKNLYEYAFNNYKYYNLIDKENFNINDDYFYEDELYIEKSFGYPLREAEKDMMKTKIILSKTNDYANFDKVGELQILFDGREIYKDDIKVEIIEVEDQNWFSKIMSKLFG